MTQSGDDTVLYDEAFELVRESHDDRTATNAKRAAEWASRSPRHRAAFERAQAEWALLGEARMKALGPAGHAMLFLEHKAAALREHPGRTLAFGGAALCAFVLLPMMALFDEPQTPRPVVPPTAAAADKTTRYATPYGRQATRRLADGSTLSMNWSSELTVELTKDKRSVELSRGEAVFTVASDPDRPFTVNVGNILVRAVGTEFSVRKVDSNDADVVVTEGVVTIGPGAGEAGRVRLQANQAITVREGRLGAVRKISSHNAYAWRDGMLVFDRQPLSFVLTELDRYTLYSIRTDRLLDADRKVTATYFIDETDDALRSLAQLFDLDVKFRGNVATVRSASPKRPGE